MTAENCDFAKSLHSVLLALQVLMLIFFCNMATVTLLTMLYTVSFDDGGGDDSYWIVSV